MSKQVEPTFRVTVLKEAAQLVTVDRAKQHGSALDNFPVIANTGHHILTLDMALLSSSSLTMFVI